MSKSEPAKLLVFNKAAYGPWPGLAEEQLFQDADVWALTDYRTIFSEVLLKRLHNNKLHIIFRSGME
jgi:uncharacterized protein (DUF1501 family)